MENEISPETSESPETTSATDDFIEGQNYSSDDVDQDDENIDIDLSNQTERVEWKDKTEYTFFVDSLEVGESKNSGRKQITWKLKCPAVNNWSLKHYTGLDDTGLWATEEILIALGLITKGDKVVSVPKRKCIGRRLSGYVILEDYQGRPSAKLKKVKAHKDGPVPDDLAF
jgi:hypothetical protein